MSSNKLTLKQSAEALGVSVDTVRRRIKAGKLRAYKEPGAYGEQWVISPDDLAKFQQVIEVIPIKYEMNPDTLMENIKISVVEAVEEASRKGTAKAMLEYRQEIESLRNEIQELKGLLINQQERKGFLSWFKK